MKNEPITGEKIDELLSFAPLFSQFANALEPKWGGGKLKETGSFDMPFPEYSEPVVRFFELAGQPCWTDYDYWDKPTEETISSDAYIAAASLDEIKTLLTYCTRGERFCSGHWGTIIRQGRVTAILSRLMQFRKLLESADSSQVDLFRELLARCWEAYDRLALQPFVVRPSIPILFFGDSSQYFKSPLRIVTVGLNPSHAEFPESARFSRFSAWTDSTEVANRRDHSLHLAALNSYFRWCPYTKWFKSLEPMLNGLNASYYGGTNAALHTDICTPIATAPTWSHLHKDQRALLEQDGAQIWHSLIEALDPDVMIISVAARHLERIRFPFLTPEQDILTIERKRFIRV